MRTCQVSDKRRATLEGLYCICFFLSFYVDCGPMADIPRNKVCAFENITAIHCIRQRQGKRFHTVPNATISIYTGACHLIAYRDSTVILYNCPLGNGKFPSEGFIRATHDNESYSNEDYEDLVCIGQLGSSRNASSCDARFNHIRPWAVIELSPPRTQFVRRQCECRPRD